MTARSLARVRFDYAVRAAAAIAAAPAGGLVKAARIAQEERIPSAFLARILAALVEAGLVRSTRGSNGGYRLAVPATSISLRAILRAVDSPAFEEEPSRDGEGPLWAILDRELDRVLDSISLDRMIAAAAV